MMSLGFLEAFWTQRINQLIPLASDQLEACCTATDLSVVVQSLSRIQLFATPWPTTCQAPLSFTISQSLLKFMSIDLVMPSNHLILCRPLRLLPSIFPSIRVFSVSQLFESDGQWIGVSASASVLPMNTWTDLLQDGLVGSPCSPRDSQESSRTPPFESIDSSALHYTSLCLIDFTRGNLYFLQHLSPSAQWQLPACPLSR